MYNNCHTELTGISNIHYNYAVAKKKCVASSKLIKRKAHPQPVYSSVHRGCPELRNTGSATTKKRSNKTHAWQTSKSP